jgi:hypothetical protein
MSDGDERSSDGILLYLYDASHVAAEERPVIQLWSAAGDHGNLLVSLPMTYDVNGHHVLYGGFIAFLVVETAFGGERWLRTSTVVRLHSTPIYSARLGSLKACQVYG